MSRFLSTVALLGIIAAAVVTVLCVVLLPLPNVLSTGLSYFVSDDGIVTFMDGGEKEKLRIKSNVLNFTNGLLGNVSTSCGNVQTKIEKLDRFDQNSVQVCVGAVSVT